MMTRNLKHLIEIFLVLWTSTLFRVALAATAFATVTVTILSPIPSVNELSLSSMQMDMHGKSSGELTITNHSSKLREIQFELVPASGAVTECVIRHSPVASSIPPGGSQVVRLMFKVDEMNPCLTDYQIEISDMDKSGELLFSVPVYTAQRSN